jgi:hypothetical protein
VVEVWVYPDGSRLLELSTKCRPDEAFQVAAEARAFLAGRGVDLDAEQQTKTRTALEFFAAELKAEGGDGAAAAKAEGGDGAAAAKAEGGDGTAAAKAEGSDGTDGAKADRPT